MENKEQFNLNRSYSYFSDTIEKSVLNSVSSFFENKFDLFLASITESKTLKNIPFLRNELFYTCQISIKNKQHVTLRLTSDFIRIVFHDIFGSNYPVFDLEKLTELEQKILNSFFEYTVKELDGFLINEKETDKINPLNKTELNFIFLIKTKDVNAGKLCITVPLNRFSVKLPAPVQSFTYDDFIENFAYVNLIAGHTKISLDDLKNLTADDIIVLEKSNIKTMVMKTETITNEIKVNPEPSLMIEFEDEEVNTDNTEDIKYKERYMPENTNMWDDIQIEVSAEFQRVKMTLGELKQISKGLVIDLGPVMKNEISLLVENKAVAKGELVIINDKYGVKITEVYAAKKQSVPTSGQTPPPAAKAAAPQAQAQQKPQPQQTPQRQAQPQAQRPAQQQAAQRPAQPQQRPMPQKPAKPQAAAKEDFDYSNFEE